MKTSTTIPAILLIATMFAIAEYTGQKEIIFPEIAALALGAWVMEKSPWQSHYLHFWLSPTLAALTGILIVRFFPYAPFFMVTGAFCLVALQLKLFRSAVLPSISAAILPIITRSDSWYYPVSVCLLTGSIAFGYRLVNRSDSEIAPSRNVAEHAFPPEMSTWSAPELAHWGKLLAGVIVVTGIAAGFDLTYMVAPPLIVAFIELSKPNGALQDKAFKGLALLVFAAFSGVFWLQLMQGVLHWPVWVSACSATTTMFLFYSALRMPFPPAVAIALLPTVLPENSILSYPWQVLAGSSAFVALSRLCFKNSLRTSGAVDEMPAVEETTWD